MRALLLATVGIAVLACGAPAAAPSERPLAATARASVAAAATAAPISLATVTPAAAAPAATAPATPTPRPVATPTPRPVSTPPPAASPATPAPTAARPSPQPPTVTPPPATPAPSPQRYVAIGASDTVGVGATDPKTGSWPSRLATRMPTGSVYTNLGVSGSLAAQARTAQLPGALAAKPTLVTVWLAVNDLNALYAPDVYGRELGAIVDGLVAGTEAKVFLGNVPDLRPVPIYAAIDPMIVLAQVNAFNSQIAQVAAKHSGRVVVVDLFAGSATLVTSATVSADGFHPSDDGYALIADRFAAAITAAGVPLR